MKEIIIYLLVCSLTWIIKGLIDKWVEKSKLTENKIDDLISNSLKKAFDSISFKKFKK